MILFRTLALLGLTALCATPVVAKEYRGNDWSHSFYENCPPPAKGAIGWTTSGSTPKLRFKLAPGQVGGCSSDAKPRGGARFWERAEVRQRGDLARGQMHDIQFDARFREGFTGKEETFFQVHGWSKNCSSAPLIMLRFDRGQLEAHILHDRGNAFASNPSRGDKGALKQVLTDSGLKRQFTINSLNERTNKIRVKLDMRARTPRASLWINGQTVVDNIPMHMRACSVPHVKFGIYRPGKRSKQTSVLFIDKVKIRSQN